MTTKKKSKKSPKSASKPALKPAPKAAAAEPEGPVLHGVDVLTEVSVKKAGTAKNAAPALLNLNQIKVVKGMNPRSDVGDIDALAKSISTDGLISPILVRPSKSEGEFELVAGGRRYAALRSLKWDHPIPVLIRTDLEDDDRALAVAIAENSEDGRVNLNPIEIGRAVKHLADEDWPVGRIAKETGLASHRIRRALALMDTPVEVQKRVENGTMSLNAGLEYARLDDPTRKQVAKALEGAEEITATEIKRIRKEVSTKARAEEAPEKKGKPTKRVVTAWKGSREKQQMIETLCHDLVELRDESDFDALDVEFIALRSAACMLLWDRGDLEVDDVLGLPVEDTKDAAEKKTLALLWKIIRQEAAKKAPTEAEAVASAE